MVHALSGIEVTGSRPLKFVLPADASKTALLMIDFQGDFCDDSKGFVAVMGANASDNRKAMSSARLVLKAARAAGVRVIHTIEAHRPDLRDLSESKFRRSRLKSSVPVIGEDAGNGRLLIRGSVCNGLCDEVAFIDGEVAIHKPGKGAFCDTELRAWLDYFGVTHLLFCGVTTECCVQTTMREANDRGYDVLVIEDATASCVPCMKQHALSQMLAFGGIVGCGSTSAAVASALARLSPRMPTAHIMRPVEERKLEVIDVSVLVAKLGAITNPCDVRGAVDTEVLRCAQAIDRACRETGFFYVVGHGIEEQAALACARDFFLLDLDAKMQLKASGGEGSGYEPPGSQVLDEGRLGEGVDGAARLGDQKESFIIGKSAPSQRATHDDRIDARWPPTMPGFKDALLAYHDATELFLGRVLLRAIALGLGLAADTFDFVMKDPMTKVRLLRYPATDSGLYAGDAPGCGSHTDWGTLTVIAQDDVGGLEVCVAPSYWREVKNVPEALLVNVGDMLSLWTAGRYRSAPHRVLKPKKASTERHSVAVFFNCDHDALIDPRALMPNASAGVPQNAHIFTAEEYILERVKGTYGQSSS